MIPILALDRKLDRNKREEKKRAKLCSEISYQENRVKTRRAAGQLARTKAMADMPLPGQRKPKQPKPKGKRK